MVRTIQANGAMYKKFKSIDELLEFVKDTENIETFESGEVTLKDWIDLGTSAEKYKKDHKLALDDKRKLQGKIEEGTKKTAELTEQLDSANNELAGLKELLGGDGKEALQKLNKEKSDLLGKYNTAEAKIRDLEKQVTQIPELEKQVEGYKTASNRSQILDAVKKAAAQRKVPQHIIDDPHFARVVTEDFAIDETGNIFTKGDSPQSVDNYIAEQQKDKPHWMPTSQGGAIGESLKPNGGSGAVSDDEAVLAAYFA